MRSGEGVVTERALERQGKLACDRAARREAPCGREWSPDAGARTRKNGSPVKVICRITYPNGKSYIGRDLTDDIDCSGSADRALVAADFTRDWRRDFTVRREIIWESETATALEVALVEARLIREHRANDPAVGYNRWPPLRGEG